MQMDDGKNMAVKNEVILNTLSKIDVGQTQ